MQIDPNENTIVCGDNIEWLNDIPDNSVDLCYIDPPYFTGQDKDIVWKNGAEKRSFGDKFKGDARCYIDWLTPRIEQIRRVLKPTGSLFLQCDWHASHHIRVMLEKIFGVENFRNEIIWQRTSSSSDSKSFGNKHDTIFFYSKGESFKFFPIYEPYDEKYKKKFSYKDDKGFFRDIPLTAKGLQGGGYKYVWNGVECIWKCPIETMRKYEAEDRLYYTRTGKANRKQYLHEMSGRKLQDVWNDISAVNSQSKEGLKYPTQKPEELIKRIILCASAEGDLILDCFSGGGTTPKAALDLNRKFICGDVSPVSVRIQAGRLEKHGYLNGKDFLVKGLGLSKDRYLEIDGKVFEKMICDVRGWLHSGTGGGDNNIDGWAGDIPVQIKNRRTPANEQQIERFFGTLNRFGKQNGFFVAWDYTKGARSLASQFSQENGVCIELMPCKEALGPLVFSDELQALYDKIYDEFAPLEWSHASLNQSA